MSKELNPEEVEALLDQIRERELSRCEPRYLLSQKEPSNEPLELRTLPEASYDLPASSFADGLILNELQREADAAIVDYERTFGTLADPSLRLLPELRPGHYFKRPEFEKKEMKNLPHKPGIPKLDLIQTHNRPIDFQLQDDPFREIRDDLLTYNKPYKK